VVTLRVRELELPEAAARLRWIVVRDCGLEVLAQRRRLSELSAQPPQQPDGVRPVAHSFFT
jgi:hypothetical protein